MGLLIPCSQELVGSNPTPRAYLGDLYINNKKEKHKKFSSKHNLSKTITRSVRILDEKNDLTIDKIDRRNLHEKINDNKTMLKIIF